MVDDRRSASLCAIEEHRTAGLNQLSSVMLLATAIAHEINNPLQGALASVKALREGMVAEDKREEYFDAVHDGLSRIRGTVQGLLKQAQRTEALCANLTPLVAVGPRLLLLLAAVEAHDGEFTLQRDGDRGLLLTLRLNADAPNPGTESGPHV